MMTFLLIFGVFAVGVVIGLMKVNQTNKLTEAGTIQKREYGFWKKRYYFIMKNGDFDRSYSICS